MLIKIYPHVIPLDNIAGVTEVVRKCPEPDEYLTCRTGYHQACLVQLKKPIPSTCHGEEYVSKSESYLSTIEVADCPLYQFFKFVNEAIEQGRPSIDLHGKLEDWWADLEEAKKTQLEEAQ